MNFCFHFFRKKIKNICRVVSQNKIRLGQELLLQQSFCINFLLTCCLLSAWLDSDGMLETYFHETVSQHNFCPQVTQVPLQDQDFLWRWQHASESWCLGCIEVSSFHNPVPLWFCLCWFFIFPFYLLRIYDFIQLPNCTVLSREIFKSQPKTSCGTANPYEKLTLIM